MPQTKTIKIFLGSSIVELHDERVIFGDYIMNSVRPIFKYDNVDVEVVKCEDMDLGYTGEPTQNIINRHLQGCNYLVFVFKHQAGEKTRLEFDLAQEMQKSKNCEKPILRVYIYDGLDEEKSKDLIDFEKRLIKDGLYWSKYKNVEDLRGQVEHHLLQFERQLLGMPATDIEQESITEKDGDALVEKYEQNEQAHEQTQAPLRKEIHQRIDDLLQQTETVMENKGETIAEKIFKVIELYKKADRWAEATAYDKKKYFDLLFDYAQFLYKYGLYRDAESIYLRQIPLAEELYGAEHEETATSYNEIGVVYDAQGDYGKALEYYQKALEIKKKVLGTEHPSTATSYNNIGMVYWRQGDYGKALEYYQKALEIDEKVLGKEHPGTATDYNNIGLVYKKQGDYGKALEYYQKALAIKEKVLGTEHPSTATSYNNIGMVYDAQGDYGKALECYQKALEIVEKVLGTKHTYTATSYNNIGAVYHEQGDYGKALEYYQKALEIQKNALGTKHPLVATDYNNIGLVYKAQGDYGKALEYYQKALEIREKVLGTEHPDTAGSYNNIGTVYYEMKDYPKALEYLGKALAIYKSKLGDEHPYTQSTFGWILQTLIDMGMDEKAIEDFFRNLFGK